jgi:CxxC motif-containing protein (DUF1111 family)
MKPAQSLSVMTLTLLFAGMVFSQNVPPQDPGVQGGNRGTGAALPSVLENNPSGILSFFTDGQSRFQAVEDVSALPNNGLGPRFNSNQCSSCHAQPAVGGSGAAINPQFLFPSNGVAPGNTIPPFITANGPTREARFPYFLNSNGTVSGNLNGGVEDLFTISGRSDAGTCTSLPQPNFAAAIAGNDIIYRIPTPVFGDGLIENIDESTLLVNLQHNLTGSAAAGIAGSFNHNGNDGTITRFGWKAQNKSMHIFSGEAYNVEMGISNLLFTQDRPLPEEDMLPNLGLPSTCLNLTGTGYPEDTANPSPSATPPSGVLDDVSAFANFMRSLAPPPPGPVLLNGQQVSEQSIADGAAEFSEIGCQNCHNSPVGPTQVSNYTPSLGQAQVAAFSDIEIHDMGTLLADNVNQGEAGGNQFRTAPLWGLGQRIFLLHDGRTTNLLAAIQDHLSNGSEADMTINNFNTTLTTKQQQDILNFLRSL